MKTRINLENALVITCLILSIIGCKKQELINSISLPKIQADNTLNTAKNETTVAQIITDQFPNTLTPIMRLAKNIVSNEIIIYPNLVFIGNTKFLLVDKHGEHYNYFSQLSFLTRIQTHLKGNIKVSQNGWAIIYDGLAKPIYRIISETESHHGFRSAELDIREYDGSIVIDNIYPDMRLNRPPLKIWTLGHIDYLLSDKNGNVYRFNTDTPMPLRTITKLRGNQIQITRNGKVIFDNID